MTDRFPPLSEQERANRLDLGYELASGRTRTPMPRRPKSEPLLPAVLGIIAVAVLYPLYGAVMLAMEAALFLDMPFRQAWDRVWVRWLLFVSFCYAKIGVTMAIKALVKWVRD